MFLMTSGMNFLCLFILLKVAAGPSEPLGPSVSLVMSDVGEKYWLGGLTVYWIGEIP